MLCHPCYTPPPRSPLLVRTSRYSQAALVIAVLPKNVRQFGQHKKKDSADNTADAGGGGAVNARGASYLGRGMWGDGRIDGLPVDGM